MRLTLLMRHSSSASTCWLCTPVTPTACRPSQQAHGTAVCVRRCERREKRSKRKHKQRHGGGGKRGGGLVSGLLKSMLI